jgi:hypothetical protein
VPVDCLHALEQPGEPPALGEAGTPGPVVGHGHQETTATTTSTSTAVVAVAVAVAVADRGAVRSAVLGHVGEEFGRAEVGDGLDRR